MVNPLLKPSDTTPPPTEQISNKRKLTDDQYHHPTSETPNKRPRNDQFLHSEDGKFKVYPMLGDGNCLFRAMAYYALGKQSDHLFMRQLIVRYVHHNWDSYRDFTIEDRASYLGKMCRWGSYGSHMELVAFTGFFECRIELYFKGAPDRDPSSFGSGNRALLMLYTGPTDAGHYDVLIPLSTPNIGIGMHKDSIKHMRQNNLEEFRESIKEWNYLCRRNK